MTSLETRMLLHRFMCNQFGYKNLRSMIDRIDDAETQLAGNHSSPFAQALMLNRNDHTQVSTEDLERYDANIATHSTTLHLTAENGRSWKPFQYLALLFTERYLDLYFISKENLVSQLNQWKTETEKMSIADYTKNDIHTLAFQSATGSGKTLLMHANIQQYKHYLKKFHHANKLNKIILVTPDEGLSRQHLTELQASNIPAQLFSDSSGGVFDRGGGIVDIIDLHKLDDKKGIKRVSLDAFEDNNLVMVDEGHLGTGGKVWRNRRKQLAHNGFTFEYSATFNQAVAGSGDEPKRLRDEYGKAILFDYAYKHFYTDGYGKDYRITNLQNTDDGEANNHYLLACALTFYQQCKIYTTKGNQWPEYNIAPPLWVFLGKTVTGSKTTSNQATESDVIRIIRFIAWLLSNPRQVTTYIKQLTSDNSGLTDAAGNDIFRLSFSHISNTPPLEIYDNLCTAIFHGKGQLQVDHLTAADELQLRTGDSPPFGVINVGDPSGLYTRLDTIINKAFTLSKNHFAKPLFAKVDHPNSPVTIVIGARRFAAGWNSWRVSTMGLMHVGRGEGPQIIQMFGRGVRLKGHSMSLKRHTALDLPRPPDSHQLRLLETLNIFGLKANYMDKFREHLQQEGIGAERTIFTLPVKKQFNETKHLKILQKRDSAGKFEYLGKPIDLPSNPNKSDYVTLDRHKRLQMLASQPQHTIDPTPATQECKLNEKHVALLNKLSIYHRVLQRKHRSSWHNMTISQTTVNALLENKHWYTLHIQPQKLEPTGYHRVREWEDLAVDLICEYANRYWRRERNIWEHKHIEIVPLDKNNANYFDEYKISVDAGENQLIEEVEKLVKSVKNNTYEEGYKIGEKVTIWNPPFHTYTPLLCASPETQKFVRISPVALNKGESTFIEHMQEIIEKGEDKYLSSKKIYLMRNLGRGRGVSFFDDYGFYPDFILWAECPHQQDILFIDPKGLVRLNERTKRKLALHKRIKQTEQKIQPQHPPVFLHSYIWSVTKREDIDWGEGDWTKEKCKQNGIVLASDGALALREMLAHALTHPPRP